MATGDAKRSAMLGESGYERFADDAYFTEHRCTRDFLTAYGERLRRPVLEPSAGRGDMMRVFREFDFEIAGFDLRERGIMDIEGGHNFLQRRSAKDFQLIATNPPYDVVDGADAEMFVRHALELMRGNQGQVAMFLRTEFYGSKRRAGLFTKASPFAAYLPLRYRPLWDWWIGKWTCSHCEREVETAPGVRRCPACRKLKPSPRHAFGWFVWDWRWTGCHAETWLIPEEPQKGLFA